jgi:hypothetical protein
MKRRVLREGRHGSRNRGCLKAVAQRSPGRAGASLPLPSDARCLDLMSLSAEARTMKGDSAISNEGSGKPVLAVSSSWRNSFKSWWHAAFTFFSYTPLAYLLGRGIWVIAPPPQNRSAYNNLIFPFASNRSPLSAGGRYPVRVTAGVLPKRFHAHNDCELANGSKHKLVPNCVP